MIKNSYGLACIRCIPQQSAEILFVKKIFTYAFVDFMNGFYKSNDVRGMRRLFNGMSFNEKMDIMTLDFDLLWNKAYTQRNYATTIDRKEKLKKKFYLAFVRDKGTYLKRLISGTECEDPTWELPKGRANKEEKKLDAAQREFREEVNCDKVNYKILFHCPPYTESYIAQGITYCNTYWFALMLNNKWEPIIQFNPTPPETLEVQSIKWLNLSVIKQMNLPEHQTQRLTRMFYCILRKLKNYMSIKMWQANQKGIRDCDIEESRDTLENYM